MSVTNERLIYARLRTVHLAKYTRIVHTDRNVVLKCSKAVKKRRSFVF